MHIYIYIHTCFAFAVVPAMEHLAITDVLPGDSVGWFDSFDIFLLCACLCLSCHLRHLLGLCAVYVVHYVYWDFRSVVWSHFSLFCLQPASQALELGAIRAAKRTRQTNVIVYPRLWLWEAQGSRSMVRQFSHLRCCFVCYAGASVQVEWQQSSPPANFRFVAG